MTFAAATEAAHVCACGHYRGHHAEGRCRECDCERFLPAVLAPLRPALASGAAAVLAAVDAAPAPRAPRSRRRPEPAPAAAAAEPVETWGGVECRKFARAVWRLRREQRRFFATRTRPALVAAQSAEKEVDFLLSLMLEALAPPPDPQGSLFVVFPALSEFLRRNPTEAKREAEHWGKREHKACLEAGMSADEATERAKRAAREFLARVHRG